MFLVTKKTNFLFYQKLRFFNEKMPVVQRWDSIIDFNNASVDEKFEFVYDLLIRQRNSALNTLEHENLSDRVKVCLIFVILICSTNFCVVLVSATNEETYSYADFLHLYSIKLKEQFDELDIDFYVHN